MYRIAVNNQNTNSAFRASTCLKAKFEDRGYKTALIKPTKIQYKIHLLRSKVLFLFIGIGKIKK